MKLVHVVAVADNNVIGTGNQMPWHIPEDFRHFKAVTMGKPMIMGRKTFESIGKALPGRTTIIISRSGFEAENTLSAPSLDTAIETAKDIASRDGVDEIAIAGGAQIYALTLPMIDRLYLTRVHLSPDNGDAFYPDLNMNEWAIVEERQGQDKVACTYLTLDRI